ncbi:MAG TPA: hypothetical protein VFU47_02110, partial [Armatimonadota bacterium]|nr:hypothetical protein [Armatimonadota bacterium]
MRDPIQTARDRQTLEKFPESEAWAALARGIRERIALHTETLLLSTPREPDEAFALVHRQQALVRELE